MDTRLCGPTVPFCEELHAQKYRSEGETFRDAMSRVASALKDSDEHFHVFRDILLDMRFMPAGRIQASMGSIRVITPYNCFVSPTIVDSFVDGENSIMDTALKAAATMRMGGGIGYDFSTLRPKGAMIKKLQSRSSGPISFMEIYDAVCRCTASSGHRRGAQMGVLRVDHPDVEEFIHAKNNQTKLTGFNISLAVTDEFMAAASTGKAFPLRFGEEIYRFVDAAELWELIMRSTWDWAEPGVIFIDQINRMNNLYYCEKIAATNPCGEQPLPPFGACLLGSFNLVKYISKHSDGAFSFDIDRLTADIPAIVRAMDNVVDRAIYPLPEQKAEALSKRRMGLGVTGLANTAEVLGYVYGSDKFIKFETEVLKIITNECYRASALLAAEKGGFPLFNAKKYKLGQFVKTLDKDVQALIIKNGIRNSHLTSIAPTGTISLCADNVSSGIEPVFEYEFDRTVIEFDGPRKETVCDYGVVNFGVRGRRCSDVTAKEHVDVLVAAQICVDSAVSKTCNVSTDMPWEAFKNIYFDSWQRGAKGCATFRLGGKRSGMLEIKEDAPSCTVDPVSGKRDCT